MAFLCRPTQGSKLIISGGLKAMLGYQPQTLQLDPHDPISFGLMVELQRLHSLTGQGWSGMSTALESRPAVVILVGSAASKHKVVP